MNIITVSFEQLLDFRRSKNLEIFSDSIKDSTIDVFVQATPGILMKSSVNRYDEKWLQIQPYVNQSIKFYDKRIVSHSFTRNTDWPSPTDSTFTVQPDSGKKLIISFIQVRLPKNIKLTPTNKLHYEVYLYIEAYKSVVKVIDLQYSSVLDLVKKSNTPLNIPNDIVSNLSQDKVLEVEFRYADPYTLEGSPLILRSSLGEHIKIFTDAHTPYLDINDNPLIDDAWIIINGKQVIDF